MEIKELREALLHREFEGLLLDLDNTVYAYKPAHQAALNACRNYFAKLLPEHAAEFDDRYAKARDSVHHRLLGQAAMHSRLLYFQYLLEQVLQRTEPAWTLELEELYWSTFMHHMHPEAEILDLLAVCKKQHIPVCVVTDLTAQIQHRKLQHLGLHESIRYMVSSEECGAEKPAAIIFEMALQKLSITAQKAIAIGDSPEKDIKGAENAGIQAVLYSLTHV